MQMRFSLLCYYFLVNTLLFGQDTISLPIVEVSAQAIRNSNVGSTQQTWTSQALTDLPAQNVATLLARETGVFIKNYGLGSLSTSSIRGGSAGHTLVLWNGLPLQSPMLGLLDLSLLPTQTSESISLEKGGNSALWGSGAIGGVIELDNQANFDNRIRVASQTIVGSFGQQQQHAQLALGNAKLQSVSKFNYQAADNDFYYFISPNLPDRQQTNARFVQQNWLQDFYWKPNEKQMLTFHYWGQTSDRQIPPTNVQTRSLARQDDRSHRMILEGRQIGKRNIWNAKVAFFQEQLDYFDEQILLESPSQFQTWMSEISAKWQIQQKHQLSLGGSQFFTRATTTNYQEGVQENRWAAFAVYRLQQNRWQLQSSLRQERVADTFLPLIPHLQLHYQANPAMNFHLKISRNYRLPTLNDRFWLPGGNENLLPESGWSQEAGLEQQFGKKAFRLNYQATAFNRLINNWILWSIQEGQSFWSANNITKVWSRGIEQRLQATYEHSQFSLNLDMGYDYIRSTNQIALERPKLGAGDQLVYTPEHQVFAKIGGQWKGFSAFYQQFFTSSTQGINDAIPAYALAHAGIAYRLKRKIWEGSLFFHAHNLWDEDYFIVERRPMPGRYFSGGINIIFQKRMPN